MNVLVISHTYISRVGREKWRELVRNHNVNVRIVVPDVWKDYLFTIRFEENRDDELDVRGRPIAFSGKEAAHFYRTLSFTMGAFKPDILHVEEGTDALSYAQALFYKKLFAPKARTMFFTWMNFEKTLRFPFSWVERYNLARSDAAICGNSDAKDILRKKGFEKPIHVMPLLGLDPEMFCKRDGTALRKKLGLNGVVIGFVGRFVPEKGVLDLIEVASRIEGEISLLLIGGGELEDEMRRRAEEKGVASRLHIVKSIPHREVPDYLNAMDAVVLPSYTVPHWKEQFGQVLVQAMASEIPVLGSSHAEIPNVIGDAGLVFEERNIEDFREKLQQLVSSAELRSDLGPKGRMRVLSHFSNTRIAAKTYSVYRQILGI